ncbi:MAG: magnesium chelatase domain-containing protein, partial [Bacteroidota bacterium]
KDVFLNVTGGISVDDPAIDLAVVAAILSSNEDIAVGKDVCFAGEVGLSGEIRAVNRVDQRISEAEKLGFETIVISKYNRMAEKHKGIKVQSVALIEEVYRTLFK